eukprot:RCo033053
MQTPIRAELLHKFCAVQDFTLASESSLLPLPDDWLEYLAWLSGAFLRQHLRCKALAEELSLLSSEDAEVSAERSLRLLETLGRLGQLESPPACCDGLFTLFPFLRPRSAPNDSA